MVKSGAAQAALYPGTVKKSSIPNPEKTSLKLRATTKGSSNNLPNQPDSREAQGLGPGPSQHSQKAPKVP